MPTIKLHLSIGYPTAVRTDIEEIDDDLWENLNAKEREKLLDEIAEEWAANYIEFSVQVEEPND
jgi:hypothetical protein